MRVRAFDLVAVSALALLGSMPGCSGSSSTGDDDAESETGGISGDSGHGGSAQGGGGGSSAMAGTLGIPRAGNSSGGTYGTGGVFGECEDPDFSGADNPSHSLKTPSTATGTNGTFEDRCDENDNLVEHTCEIACYDAAPPGTGGTAPSAYPRIVCRASATGRVTETVWDCGGRCMEGSCFHWCPTPGDTLTVVAVDVREVRFRSVSDNEYRCAPSSPAPSGCSFAVDGEVVVSRTTVCSLDRVLIGIEDPDGTPYEDCLYECGWE